MCTLVCLSLLSSVCCQGFTKLPVRLRAERSVEPEDGLEVSESMLDYTFQQAKDVLSQRRKMESMKGNPISTLSPILKANNQSNRLSSLSKRDM
jgi:hypothetical protein